MFQKVIIIGVGLIGSSLGMNIIEKGLAEEVIGCGRDVKNLKLAKKRRAIHSQVTVGASLTLVLKELNKNDLVILAAPVRSIKDYLKNIPADVLIMDVGSIKGSIVSAADRLKKRFVGAHPIAGTEKTGAGAGDKHLFQNRLCILTPGKYSTKADVSRVRTLWTQMGSKTSLMSPKEHDRLFAIFSHLPHVLAYTLMQVALKKTKSSKWELAFSSFKDATRVAASSPEMWVDIFLENKEEMLEAIEAFEDQLQKLKAKIKNNRSAEILSFLKEAQKQRVTL